MEFFVSILREYISSFFNNSAGEGGRNKEDFMRMNTGKYSENDMHVMFSHLATEGIIYSTTDENHFACI